VSLSLGAPIGGLVGASIGCRAFSPFSLSPAGACLLNAQIWPTDYAGATSPRRLMRSNNRTRPAAGTDGRVEYGALTACTPIWVSASTSSGFSAERIAEVIAFYGCGAIGGVMIGGRAADFLGTQLSSRLSLASLCASFLLLRFALDEE